MSNFSGPGQKSLVGHSDSNARTAREDSSKCHGSLGKPSNFGWPTLSSVALGYKNATESVALGHKNATEAMDKSAGRGVLKSPLSSFERCCQNDRRLSYDTALENL